MNSVIHEYFNMGELELIKGLLGLTSTDPIILNSVISPSATGDLWQKGVLVRNEGRADNKIELHLHPYWRERFRDLFDRELQEGKEND